MGFKKITAIILSSIVIFFSLLALSFGIDEDGCMFCHQYPGMVIAEKSTGHSAKLKILHIDEEEFFDSTHGEFSCKKCHTTIKSVPHTGKSLVNCTASCHREDEEKEMIQDYPLAEFHENEQSYIISIKEKSSCTVCHQLYPHSQNKTVRAFLNMHTGFMTCDVCHIKKNNEKNIIYEWKENKNTQFYGKPFGTYYNPGAKKIKKKQNTISRITVFSLTNGKKLDLTNRADVKKAIDFRTREKTMTSDIAEPSLVFFHRDIEKKQISVACDECHSHDSILNFKKLGFDEKKIKNLKTINLKGLVTEYKTFYLPTLFE